MGRKSRDSVGLDQRLQALAYPSRLRLLSKLRRPRGIGEIELEATVDDGDRGRCITREGVRHHLDKLREAGLVEARPTRSKGPREYEYVVSAGQVYELSETLRQMAIQTGNGAETVSVDEAPITWEPETDATAPRLVVVHGPQIGVTFTLSAAEKPAERGWVLGSSDEAAVHLDEDPFVADQAAEVVPKDDGYELVDLRVAEFRASVNGQELECGGAQPLEHGDIVGIGHTLLCFHTA